MEYRPFPALGRDVSRLVLGSMVFNLNALENSYAMLDRWREVGGNLIDCAPVYAGGDSERTLGRYVADRGCREELIILTKGAHHNRDRKRVTPEDIVSDLRDSLARLQTDYIDLYVLHRDDPTQPVGPIMETLNEYLANGTFRAIGASNWSIPRLEEASAYAEAHGLQPFALSSPHLSLAVPNCPIWEGCDHARDAESMAWYERTQMPLFAWSSQARGFLTGAFTPEDTSNETLVRCFYNEGNWERLCRARELGEQRGFSPIQVSLAWVLHQKMNVFPLVGPANVEEIDSCLGALELQLTDAEVAWLDLHG